MNSKIPPIVVSDKDAKELTYSDDEDYSNSHDDWEHIDTQAHAMKPLLKNKRPSQLNKLIEEESSKDNALFTSTPSNEKTVKITPMITDDQSDFNKKLIGNVEYPPHDLTNLQAEQGVVGQRKNNLNAKSDEALVSNSNVIGGGIGGRVDLVEAFYVGKDKAQQKSDENLYEFVITEEAKDLCDKILNLIFKLMWDGVVGSNEEVWKVSLALCIFFSGTVI